jgi:drug/metabolite transporter (DMT)-like permease
VKHDDLPTVNGQNRQSRTRALVALFLATLFWGLSFVAMKALGLIQVRDSGAGTWFLAAQSMILRFFLGALILSPLVFGAGRRGFTRSEWKQGLGLALYGGVGLLFQMDGVNHTHASTAAFLTQAYCLFIPVVVAIRQRKLPSRMVWLSSILVLAGVAVLSGISWNDLTIGRGELEVLFASVLFTGQILWLEKKEFAGNDMIRVTWTMFLLTGVVVAGTLIVLWPGAAVVVNSWKTPASWLLIALLTGPSTVVAYWLMNRFQPEVPATQAGLIYCAEPLFTSSFALFLPAIFAAMGKVDYRNEPITTALIVGGGLITAANVMMMLTPPAEKTASINR